MQIYKRICETGEALMSKKSKLSTSTIEQVWSLYDLGYSEIEIMKRLNISVTSVHRCITALQIAQSGRVVEYEGILRDSRHIVDYTNERFGTIKIKEPEVENLTLALAIKNLADSIEEQTKLFKSFLKKLER
jgi:hypothetical protein